MNKKLLIFVIFIFSLFQVSFSNAGENGDLKLKKEKNEQYEINDCLRKLIEVSLVLTKL